MYLFGLIVILNKIIYCYLVANILTILKNLKIKVFCYKFFISYDKINFYKNIFNQKLKIKVYIVNYITKYISFINTFNSNPILYI